MFSPAAAGNVYGVKGSEPLLIKTTFKTLVIVPQVTSQSSPTSSRPASKKKSTDKAVTQAEPKRPCRVTVSESGWHGARSAAIAAGCSSVSEMLEKLGRGELSIIASDAIADDPVKSAATFSQPTTAIPQHIHIHTPGAIAPEDDDEPPPSGTSLPKRVVTAICAAVIVGSLLYIADQIMTITTKVRVGRDRIEDIVTPVTGEVVAGYNVTDEYGIRPVHPVTGEINVPHYGVDLGMDIGTPIYAVGNVGDSVSVKCWWDKDGGGWVVDQTAESYPGYTFQSLHMSKNGCREGKAKAGEAIAYSGNSGLGTGVHYDFRVKIDGEYIPPATKYLESAVTGEPPQE